MLGRSPPVVEIRHPHCRLLRRQLRPRDCPTPPSLDRRCSQPNGSSPSRELGIDPTQSVVAESGKTAFVADFSNRIGRLDISLEGTILRTAIGTDGYLFEPSATFGGPWTRPRIRVVDDRPIWDATTLVMYQDLITAEVRAKAQGVTTATALVEGQR